MNKKFISIILTAVTSVSLLTGCSSSSASASAASTASSSSIPQGGNLVLPTTDNLGNFFTPYKQGSLAGYGWPVYQTLASYKSDNKFYPVLAESWERDNDAKTLTVHLVKTAKFSDGNPFTADDVVFSLSSRKDYGTDSTIGKPSKIEKVDDYTVKVTWDTFSLDYEQWILTQQMFSKKVFEEKGLDWMLNNMVGTGPYVMSEFIPDVSISFTRNDNYWEDKKPAPDTIKYTYFSDPTTVLASFTNGEIDSITSSDSITVDQLTAGGYKSMGSTASMEAQSIAIPLSVDANDPLSNVKVRQAIYEYGIDWKTMAAGIGGSLGYHTDAIGMNTMTYYQTSLEKSSYDLEKAKKLLAEAGYPNGFTTKIYTSQPFAQSATVLQDDLSKLGITAECEFVDYTLVQSDYISAKAAQNGICITALYFSNTLQMDRFNKHINPTGTYGKSSTEWDDKINTLWTAVKNSTTMEEQNKNLAAYVDYYVNTLCSYWPMYNTGSAEFHQEWYVTTDKYRSGASLDPFEIGTSKK